MGKAILIGIVLALLAAGGAVYAWGAGMFWPCEPVGRVLSQGQCTSLLSLDDRWIGGVGVLPDGKLLVAASAVGNAAGESGVLIEISAVDGTIIAETPLPPNEVETGLAGMAISDDGTLVAVIASYREGRRRYGIEVFDRSGTLVADIARGLPGFMKFDARNRLIVHPGGFDDVEHDPALAEAFQLDAPQNPVTPDPADLDGLFQEGLNGVVSPDGNTVAMAMGTLTDDPYVGIRMVPAERRSDAGTLFAAALGRDCNYILSDMAFSDGSRIAAEFDCPERWGQVTSALLAWDYVEGRPLASIPVIDGFADPIWLDENTLIVTRWNYGTEHHDVLRIAVPDPQ